MKSAAGAFILAIVLIVAGVVALGEARLMRQLAFDQQRLATLHYDDDSSVETTSVIGRLPFSSSASIETQRVAASYWQARYEALTPLTGSGGERQAADPQILLIAANASFRASRPETSDNTRIAVERLDGVMQAYGDVLRADPGSVDAAYNYEFVFKLRDAFAKGKPPRPRDTKAEIVSADLPVGPTMHGRPGGPPPEVPMADFKTFAPMATDERGELMETSRTGIGRKKG
jgi:hypothetical protein